MLTDGWTDRRTDGRADNRQKVIIIAHLEHSSGELKKDYVIFQGQVL